jgi:predicted nuclease of predicted toxin-antitoxin system
MNRRSGKHFGSSSASPPERPLFIDRCAWSGALGQALSKAEIPFVAHHDRFAPDASDEEWLTAAANQGWLVVTRDQKIRYRSNELAAMRRARLHVFVFTQGGLSASETGSIVVRCYSAMQNFATTVPPPAFFSLTRRGEVTRLDSARR